MSNIFTALHVCYSNKLNNCTYRRKKLAGVILLGTGGIIPPNDITKMEADCQIREMKTIYPFAYRTHTHSLGK